MQIYQRRKGELQDEIAYLDNQIDELKTQRKQTPHRLPLKSLPPEERFTRLRPERKHFLDTIKMIAYRAETSLVSLLREHLARHDDAHLEDHARLRIEAGHLEIEPDEAQIRHPCRVHDCLAPPATRYQLQLSCDYGIGCQMRLASVLVVALACVPALAVAQPASDPHVQAPIRRKHVDPEYPKEDFNAVWRSVMTDGVPEEISPFVDPAVVARLSSKQTELVANKQKTAAAAMKTLTRQINAEIERNLERDPSLREKYNRLTGRKGS